MTTISAVQAGTVVVGDFEVNRIGLGTNRIQDNDQSRTILRAAVERGINFIDTADIYTGGTSERVIGETIAPDEAVVIATKGGYHGAAPEALTAAIDASLERLRREPIDLYYLHRPDPAIAIEDSVKALVAAHDARKIRHIGLSNVSIDQIKRSEALAPIAAVQNRYNLNDTSANDVIDYCTERDIAFVPFFPLSGADKARAVAERHGATPEQIVIAAMLVRSPVIAPIPGTLSVEHLEENLRAAMVELTEAELSEIGMRAP
jgi:hypothetical protein